MNRADVELHAWRLRGALLLLPPAERARIARELVDSLDALAQALMRAEEHG